MNFLNRRKIFRWAVNFFDDINIWIEDKFNLNPRKRILETIQDNVSLKELDETIGKSLEIK